MPSYSLTLINEKKRFYDRFAVFLFVINAVAVVSFFFVKGNTLLSNISGGFTLLLLLIAIAVYSKKAWHPHRRILFYLATFAAILYWIAAGYWWAGLLTGLLAALYMVSQQNPVVAVTEKQISYPSFPVRRFAWEQLNNIILKDGLLTIDLKNNRLIQQAIDDKNSPVNEQNFNEFCRQQLQSGQKA